MYKRKITTFVLALGPTLAFVPSCTGFVYNEPKSISISDMVVKKNTEVSFVPNIVSGETDPSLNAYELEFIPFQDMSNVSYTFLASTSESGEFMYTLTIDTRGTYRFSAKLKNFVRSTLSADFTVDVVESTYNLTVVSSNDSQGLVSGSCIGYEGHDSTVEAFPNNGYQFVGWYELGREELLSSESRFNYTMLGRDVTLIGYFEAASYDISLRSNDKNKGKINYEGTILDTFDGQIPFGKEFTLKAIPMSGYSFIGWRIDNNTEYLSDSLSHTFIKDASAHTIYADFEETHYDVSVQAQNQDYGNVIIVDEEDPSKTQGKYIKGTSLQIKATENHPDKYSLQYFTDGKIQYHATKVETEPDTYSTNIVVGTEDMIITAVYQLRTTKVTLNVIDENGDALPSSEYDMVGMSSYYANGVYVGSSSNPLTIEFNENKYQFDGWYMGDVKEENKVLSEPKGYCSKEITLNVVFTAKLIKKQFHISTATETDDDPEAKVICKKGGTIIQASDVIYYGESLSFEYTNTASSPRTTFKSFEGDGGLTLSKDPSDPDNEKKAIMTFNPTDSCESGHTYTVIGKTSTKPYLNVNYNEGGEDAGVMISGSTSLIHQYRCEPETEYRVKAIAKEGYEFSYWKSGSTVISHDIEMDYKITSASVTLTAVFAKKTYTLGVSSNNSLAGTIKIWDYQEEKYLEKITLNDTTLGQRYRLEAISNDSKKYRFVQWEDAYGNVIEGAGSSYEYVVGNQSKYFRAIFDYQGYALEVSVDSSYTGGSVNIENEPYYGDNYFISGNVVKIIATPNNGYGFVGWFDQDGTLISSELSYSFTMPSKDMRFYARFAKYVSVKLMAQTYNGNNVCVVNGATETAKVGQEITVSTALFDELEGKEQYAFAGWYDPKGENKISSDNPYTFTVGGDISLLAKWNVQQHQISVNYDKTRCQSISGQGIYDYGTSVVLKADPIRDYTQFDGWIDDQTGEIVSLDMSYNINVKTDKSYTAKFSYLETTKENEGYKPTLSNDKTTITFGTFPGESITSEELNGQTNLKNALSSSEYGEEVFDEWNYHHYFKKYTGENFDVGKGAELLPSGKQRFSTGFSINYQLKPIVWDIVEEGPNYYIIQSHDIILTSYFANIKMATRYKDFADYLNTTFFNSIFKRGGSEYVIGVDISEYNLTNQKVFLLDSNTASNFTIEERKKKLTDFAFTQKALHNGDYYGAYYLRSKGDEEGKLKYVNQSGMISDTYMMLEKGIGFCPVMKITKDF